MNATTDAHEATRHTPAQRRLIVAMARHDANPFQLLDCWLNNEPPRRGFAWLAKPALDARTWTQLDALHRYAKSEATQLAHYTAVLASLLLYEKLFPADFTHVPAQRQLASLLATWDPHQVPVTQVVRDWARLDHPVYGAYFDMRGLDCVRLSSMSPKELEAHGYADAEKPRLRRSP